MQSSVDGVRIDAGASFEARAAEHARAPPNAPKGVDFAPVFRRIGHEIDRGEALMGGAARPSVERMDAGTLIALQAGIYRYGEAIDLTVKLVDRVSTAVRTILESGR